MRSLLGGVQPRILMCLFHLVTHLGGHVVLGLPHGPVSAEGRSLLLQCHSSQPQLLCIHRLVGKLLLKVVQLLRTGGEIPRGLLLQRGDALFVLLLDFRQLPLVQVVVALLLLLHLCPEVLVSLHRCSQSIVRLPKLLMQFVHQVFQTLALCFQLPAVGLQAHHVPLGGVQHPLDITLVAQQVRNLNVKVLALLVEGLQLGATALLDGLGLSEKLSTFLVQLCLDIVLLAGDDGVLLRDGGHFGVPQIFLSGELHLKLVDQIVEQGLLLRVGLELVAHTHSKLASGGLHRHYQTFGLMLQVRLDGLANIAQAARLIPQLSQPLVAAAELFSQVLLHVVVLLLRLLLNRARAALRLLGQVLALLAVAALLALHPLLIHDPQLCQIRQFIRLLPDLVQEALVGVLHSGQGSHELLVGFVMAHELGVQVVAPLLALGQTLTEHVIRPIGRPRSRQRVQRIGSQLLPEITVHGPDHFSHAGG
mmetsp:Transcript_21493/g.52249  ORF Transcript_21493/g.52249 Transcript_21493/m.52249 type:complete len:478 (+) Transcript_21493:496-1929(+)